MDRTRSRTNESQRGQAIVLMIFGVVLLIMIASLIIDGGNAWAQQRRTQNGSDSAAEAGAAVLAERLALGQLNQAPKATSACPLTDDPDVYWDCRVDAALTSMSAANGIGRDVAYYTDICGDLIPDAAPVGSGSLPVEPPADSMPCSSPTVLGVEFHGALVFDPLLRVILQSALTARADATAVAGYVTGPCAAGNQAHCRSLAVALPLNAMQCDQQGDASWTYDPPKAYPIGETVVLPICKTGPGNFGYVDWSASSGATLPTWLPNITGRHLGDLQSLTVGDIYLLPVFDWICQDDPTSGVLAQPYGCPDGGVGGLDLVQLINLRGGDNITPEFYHVSSFRAFRLDQVVTSNQGLCAQLQGEVPDPQNKSTDCLVGRFESLVTTGVVVGTITGTLGYDAAVGVQLIR